VVDPHHRPAVVDVALDVRALVGGDLPRHVVEDEHVHGAAGPLQGTSEGGRMAVHRHLEVVLAVEGGVEGHVVVVAAGHEEHP
jgi:hypothetical protein